MTTQTFIDDNWHHVKSRLEQFDTECADVPQASGTRFDSHSSLHAGTFDGDFLDEPSLCSTLLSSSSHAPKNDTTLAPPIDGFYLPLSIPDSTHSSLRDTLSPSTRYQELDAVVEDEFVESDDAWNLVPYNIGTHFDNYVFTVLI